MRLIDADALKFRDVKVTTNEIDICGFGDYIVEERKGILQEEIWDAPTIDVPQWIPCSERLPEIDEICLVTEKDGIIRHCYFDSVDPVLFATVEEGMYVRDVIAWMPLP